MDKQILSLIDSIRSHYQKRASALDFKDATAARVGHCDVVLDHLQKHVFAFNRPLFNFSKLLEIFRYH